MMLLYEAGKAYPEAAQKTGVTVASPGVVVEPPITSRPDVKSNGGVQDWQLGLVEVAASLVPVALWGRYIGAIDDTVGVVGGGPIDDGRVAGALGRTWPRRRSRAGSRRRSGLATPTKPVLANNNNPVTQAVLPATLDFPPLLHAIPPPLSEIATAQAPPSPSNRGLGVF